MKGKKVKVKAKAEYKKGGVVKGAPMAKAMPEKTKNVGKMEGKAASKRMDRKAMGGAVDKKAQGQEHLVVDGMSAGSPMSSATHGVKKKG